MIPPTRLIGHGVALERLTEADRPEITTAMDHQHLRDLFFTTTSIAGGGDAWMDLALAGAATGRHPYVVRDSATGQVLGSTSYYALEPSVPRIAIGYTWLRPSHQGGRWNPACKEALLRTAFEDLGCNSVQFHTDRFNLRSQRAIEKLGATREGILRADARRADGGLRDTVCYSILAGEWADVRRLLELRLRAFDR